MTTQVNQGGYAPSQSTPSGWTKAELAKLIGAGLLIAIGIVAMAFHAPLADFAIGSSLEPGQQVTTAELESAYYLTLGGGAIVAIMGLVLGANTLKGDTSQ